MAFRSSRFGGVRRTPAQRRATEWIASTAETGTTALAASTSVLDQFFAIAEQVTITRTRGSLWVKSDQLAATETVVAALGMAVVTDQAAAIGVTAVPTPITDQGSDSFFLWMPFAQSIVVSSAIGFDNQGFTRYDFDSKGQRKVQQDDSIVIVLENNSAVGLEFLLMFRMLVKLHV